MKRLITYFFVILFMASCQKEEINVTADNTGGTSLVLLASEDGTKALSDQTIGTFLHYRLYKGSKLVYSFSTLDNPVVLSNILPGTYTVKVANRGGFPNTEYTNILDSSFPSSASNVYKYGERSVTTTDIDGEIYEIDMHQQAAKISLSAIKTQWADYAAPTTSFVIKKVWIANVNIRSTSVDAYGKAPTDATPTFNSITSTSPSSYNVAVATPESTNLKETGSELSIGQDFYVPGNGNTSKPTSVIIQAQFDSKTCYYRVEIPNCRFGTHYPLGTVVITQIGADTPGGSMPVIIHFGDDE